MAIAAELDRFVRDALASGASRAETAEVLRSAGWPPEQVRDALDAYAEVAFRVPVPRPRASGSARDAFMYLLLFTTLYLFAFHLGSLLFDLVNMAFPDAADAYAATRARHGMRWSAATVLIALPVFLLLSRALAREWAVDANHLQSPVRRWLTWLTLAVAATALLCDTITLVYNLLGGELTLRFLLKVGIVAVIAGAIFGYYLLLLRQEQQPPSARLRRTGQWLAIASIVVAIVAVATSLFQAGMPAAQRAARLDDHRVADLQRLAKSIERHAEVHRLLPDDLAALQATVGATLPSGDPQTAEPYGYERKAEGQYQLCARFATEDSASTEWGHPNGWHCFERRAQVPQR